MMRVIRVSTAALAVGCLVCVVGFASAAWAVAEQEPEAGEGEASAAAASATPTAGLEGRVARSAFTSAVVDREPTDTLEQLGNDVRSVSYFTELRGLDGQTVIHRWAFGGEVLAEIPFEVGSPRWRVYSTKSLDPTRLGDWTVSVVDGRGNTLSEERLRYVAAGAAPREGATAPPAAVSEAE